MGKKEDNDEKRPVGRPRGTRHAEDYKRIGPPPTDPLEMIEWAGSLLAVAMHRVAEDDTMDERNRRQELRATAKVLVSLVPAERLLAAERAIRRNADHMERPTADAELKDAPTQPARALRCDSE